MVDTYESLSIINSFNAIDAATDQVIPAAEDGYITPSSNTTIVFQNPNPNSPFKYVQVNTLVFMTKSQPLKVVINDNELYPFYVPGNDCKGVEGISVNKFRVISSGEFYYEAMTSRR